VTSASDAREIEEDPRWMRAICALYAVAILRGTKRRGGAAPHPFPPDAPERGTARREVDAMTVLALIAAILEFASSLLGFLTAIVERLPIRKDKEP
jgi:hypothetical protein